MGSLSLESAISKVEAEQTAKPSAADAATLSRRPAVATKNAEVQAGESHVHKLERVSDMTYGQYVREHQREVMAKATQWGGPLRASQRKLCLAAAVLIQVPPLRSNRAWLGGGGVWQGLSSDCIPKGGHATNASKKGS